MLNALKESMELITINIGPLCALSSLPLLSFFLSIFFIIFFNFWCCSRVLFIQPLNTIKFYHFPPPYNLKSSPFFYLSKPKNPTYFLLSHSHQITHQTTLQFFTQTHKPFFNQSNGNEIYKPIP